MAIHGSEPDEGLELVALHGSSRPALEVVPASRWREWMNATDERSANRCLPLLMANESGWALLSPVGFTATWDGRDHPSGVTLEFDEPVGSPAPVAGHFGYGILTFSVPLLFRTPRGYNLLARGPANWPKDGASALEGLVETDWAVSTFTMNWKLTRPAHPVRFERDEPFCMIVPQRRGELEAFRPVVRHASTDPSAEAGMRAFAEQRQQMHVRKFLAEHAVDFKDSWSAWEKDYFRGFRPDGTEAPEHQTKLRLAEFGEQG